VIRHSGNPADRLEPGSQAGLAIWHPSLNPAIRQALAIWHPSLNPANRAGLAIWHPSLNPAIGQAWQSGKPGNPATSQI